MSIPTAITKRLRACLGCTLLKTQAQFREEGCENCPMLKIKEHMENLLDCTTDKYTGVVALTNTKNSWVAKWQHLEGYFPGLYALVLEGELPESKIMALEKSGRTYLPRNKSFII